MLAQGFFIVSYYVSLLNSLLGSGLSDQMLLDFHDNFQSKVLTSAEVCFLFDLLLPECAHYGPLVRLYYKVQTVFSCCAALLQI